MTALSNDSASPALGEIDDLEELAYCYLVDGQRIIKHLLDPDSADFDAKIAADVSIRIASVLTGLESARAQWATAWALLGGDEGA